MWFSSFTSTPGRMTRLQNKKKIFLIDFMNGNSYTHKGWSACGLKCGLVNKSLRHSFVGVKNVTTNSSSLNTVSKSTAGGNYPVSRSTSIFLSKSFSRLILGRSKDLCSLGWWKLTANVSIFLGFATLLWAIRRFNLIRKSRILIWQLSVHLQSSHLMAPLC